MSETYLAVQGWVGTEIRLREVSEGVSVASFRVAATPQQYNASTASWSNRPTNWFTVECWRALAANVSQSMSLGQPVVVTGRFRTTEWKDDAGNPRSSTVIEATAVGHDLSKGVATFTRSNSRSQFPTSTEGSSLRGSDETPALTSTATAEDDLPRNPDRTGSLIWRPLVARLLRLHRIPAWPGKSAGPGQIILMSSWAKRTVLSA